MNVDFGNTSSGEELLLALIKLTLEEVGRKCTIILRNAAEHIVRLQARRRSELSSWLITSHLKFGA